MGDPRARELAKTKQKNSHLQNRFSDKLKFKSALQAIIGLGCFNLRKEIHGYIMRSKLEYDAYVCTSLVDMYIKNDCLDKAENSLISGYTYKWLFDNAENLLNQMKEEGIKADLVTWNSLVLGYSMTCYSEEALAVINRIESLGLTPNVVSWTAMISGYCENENYMDALQFFSQMQEENEFNFPRIIHTCAHNIDSPPLWNLSPAASPNPYYQGNKRGENECFGAKLVAVEAYRKSFSYASQEKCNEEYPYHQILQCFQAPIVYV
ncbi:hypothetical protein JHK82_039699 [Glycine max]|nr:hypothetical protein JHK86_039893 [Glycine max]KAG4965498.1 hypothetical protein JHK85_040473 [Glycine max]KAG5110476.1 hypothetical protein JHK82_039699 [Glycine max]KAG5121764.1 hypothetical protein JHK84_040104 [Glycine max]